MSERTVCDSSPLIGLHQIGRMDLLRGLFVRLTVPPAVVKEVAPEVSLPDWICLEPLRQPAGSRLLSASLGPGESEAIALAMEISADLIILDDRPARRLAQSLGLSVVGTVGILLAAKRRGMIPLVRPELDALLSHDFRISSELYEFAVSDAGEAG